MKLLFGGQKRRPQENSVPASLSPERTEAEWGQLIEWYNDLKKIKASNAVAAHQVGAYQLKQMTDRYNLQSSELGQEQEKVKNLERQLKESRRELQTQKTETKNALDSLSEILQYLSPSSNSGEYCSFSYVSLRFSIVHYIDLLKKNQEEQLTEYEKKVKKLQEEVLENQIQIKTNNLKLKLQIQHLEKQIAQLNQDKRLLEGQITQFKEDGPA